MNVRVALVVVLAISAGCSALDTSGEATTTVTPAPVPQPNETAEAETLPPGVTGNAIVDINRLGGAHRQATNSSSYTWHSNYVVVRTLDNGTLNNTVRQGAYVENQSVYTYWTNRKEAEEDQGFNYLGNYTEYADGKARYTRLAQGNEYQYAELAPQPARRQVGQRAGASIIEYLQAENVTVALTVVDGERGYEITGTDYALPTAGQLRNYSVRAIVTSEGFVRSLNVSFTRMQGGEREMVTYSFAYTQVGNTTVEEPAWVREQWGENRSMDE